MASLSVTATQWHVQPLMFSLGVIPSSQTDGSPMLPGKPPFYYQQKQVNHPTGASEYKTPGQILWQKPISRSGKEAEEQGAGQTEDRGSFHEQVTFNQIFISQFRDYYFQRE